MENGSVVLFIPNIYFDLMRIEQYLMTMLDIHLNNNHVDNTKDLELEGRDHIDWLKLCVLPWPNSTHKIEARRIAMIIFLFIIVSE
jgi:hypothetical protein